MKKIQADIKARSFKRIYLIYGSEDYLKTQYKNNLKSAIISPDDTMNFSAFEGKNIDLTEIISLADTVPFFSEYRLILLEDTELLKAKKGGKTEEKEEAEEGEKESREEKEDPEEKKDNSDAVNAFADYVANIPEETVILMVESKVDKRSRLYKAIAKNGYAAEMNAPDIESLGKWVTKKVRDVNKYISGNTVRMFLEKTGSDMGIIDHELEKLISYAWERAEITEEDLTEMTTVTLEDRIFVMIEETVKKNQKKALQLYYDLVALKVSPYKILALISRQFNQLFYIKAALNENKPREVIMEKAGIKFPGIYNRMSAMVRNYSVAELQQIVERCVDYEHRIKSGRIRDSVAVELLIVEASNR